MIKTIATMKRAATTIAPNVIPTMPSSVNGLEFVVVEGFFNVFEAVVDDEAMEKKQIRGEKKN